MNYTNYRAIKQLRRFSPYKDQKESQWLAEQFERRGTYLMPEKTRFETEVLRFYVGDVIMARMRALRTGVFSVAWPLDYGKMIELHQMIEIAFTVFVKYGEYPPSDVLSGFIYSWEDLMSSGVRLLYTHWIEMFRYTESKVRCDQKINSMRVDIDRMEQTKDIVDKNLLIMNQIKDVIIPEELVIDVQGIFEKELIYIVVPEEMTEPIKLCKQDEKMTVEILVDAMASQEQIVGVIEDNFKDEAIMFAEVDTKLTRMESDMKVLSVVTKQEVEIVSNPELPTVRGGKDILVSEMSNVVLHTGHENFSIRSEINFSPEIGMVPLHSFVVHSGKLRYLNVSWEERSRLRLVRNVIVVSATGKILINEMFSGQLDTIEWCRWKLRIRKKLYYYLGGCDIGGFGLKQQLKAVGLYVRNYNLFDISTLPELCQCKLVPSIRNLAGVYGICPWSNSDLFKMKVCVLLGQRFYLKWEQRRYVSCKGLMESRFNVVGNSFQNPLYENRVLNNLI